MTLRPLSIVVLLTAASLALTACGRRGALDTPSEARWEQEREAAKAAGQPAPPKPTRAPPQRSFILDGLID